MANDKARAQAPCWQESCEINYSGKDGIKSKDLNRMYTVTDYELRVICVSLVDILQEKEITFPYSVAVSLRSTGDDSERLTPMLLVTNLANTK